jgi:hypothetical protein
MGDEGFIQLILFYSEKREGGLNEVGKGQRSGEAVGHPRLLFLGIYYH